MTVRDLISILEDFEPDAEIRYASQPSWPFEYSIADVVGVDLGAPEEGDHVRWTDDDGVDRDGYVYEALTNGEVVVCYAVDEEHEERETIPVHAVHDLMPEFVVYLVEGSQLAYLPGAAKEAVGW